jgi:hypothetical protein
MSHDPSDIAAEVARLIPKKDADAERRIFRALAAPSPDDIVIEEAVPETAELLGEIVDEIRHYVVMSAAQAETIALWIMHTWALDAAEVTPYLNISGPERRVGKSRLLEVLALYAKTPIKTADISEAALFRVVAASSPTLLFDEIDTVFGPKAREQESLRGLLNAGFQRGAMAWRCAATAPSKRWSPSRSSAQRPSPASARSCRTRSPTGRFPSAYNARRGPSVSSDFASAKRASGPRHSASRSPAGPRIMSMPLRSRGRVSLTSWTIGRRTPGNLSSRSQTPLGATGPTGLAPPRSSSRPGRRMTARSGRDYSPT